MDTRREFLKKAMLLAGATGASNIVPASIQRALAIDPAAGSTFLDAEHIVILMQENRSFDHCFGTLRGVRGHNDPRAVTLPDGKPVWLQTNAQGQTFAPFHFDIKDTKVTWMGDLPHTRASQVDAYNKGRYDQWLNAKRSHHHEYADMPLTMGYYNRKDLPFNYALADSFTICDQHFCSAMTSTTPNRSYFWSGNIMQELDGRTKANIRNDDYEYQKMKWKTFPELLEDNGVAWKFYQNDITCNTKLEGEAEAWLGNFGCNLLEFFEAYKVKAANADRSSNALSGRDKQLFDNAFVTNAAHSDFRSLAPVDYTDAGTSRSVNVPKGDVLYQFRQDVQSGKLPTVSWLAAPQSFSDHPSAPWYGAWFVSEVMDILTHNPEVWKKTIFILTYDENDGYFDHVVPFSIPDKSKPGTGACSEGIDTEIEHVRLDNELKQGIPEKEAREGAVGLGFRVPMIIASPWTRGGRVCSQLFDHTSTTQFLEHFIGAKYKKQLYFDNISKWRRTICGDLTAAFTTFDKGHASNMPFLDQKEFAKQIYSAKFKDVPEGYQQISNEQIAALLDKPAMTNPFSTQEEGTRPSCAIPYELYADGQVNNVSGSFELKMSSKNQLFGNKAVGAPFTVYAPADFTGDGYEKQRCRNWSFAVAAGDELSYSWPVNGFQDGQYHLRVHGPNGFFREFGGNANDPGLKTSIDYSVNKKRQSADHVVLTVNNAGSSAQTVTITDMAYKNPVSTQRIEPAATAQILVPVAKSAGWYDFTLSVTGFEHFSKRYAGRVESGKESISDPFMGKTV